MQIETASTLWHSATVQTTPNAIILRNLVTTGRVVGTTHDVSVCDMRKRKTWVKSQNGVNLIKRMEGGKVKLIQTVCSEGKRCHMVWCKNRVNGQWHVLHPFSNTAELVREWTPPLKNALMGSQPRWRILTSVALTVIPLGGKSCDWSFSRSVGGT